MLKTLARRFFDWPTRLESGRSKRAAARGWTSGSSSSRCCRCHWQIGILAGATITRDRCVGGCSGSIRIATGLPKQRARFEQACGHWSMRPSRLPSGGEWIPVVPRQYPDFRNLDSPLRLEIALPEDCDHGAALPWRPLIAAGVKSDPAFDLVVGLAYLWDRAKAKNGGYRVYATRPKARRTADGHLLDADGNIITARTATPDPQARRDPGLASGQRAGFGLARLKPSSTLTGQRDRDGHGPAAQGRPGGGLIERRTLARSAVPACTGAHGSRRTGESIQPVDFRVVPCGAGSVVCGFLMPLVAISWREFGLSGSRRASSESRRRRFRRCRSAGWCRRSAG